MGRDNTNKDFSAQMITEMMNKTDIGIKKPPNYLRLIVFLQRAIPVLMLIFLFLSPFTQDTSIKEICIYSSIVIVLFLSLSRQFDFSFKTPLTAGFILFIIWVIIGLPFALNRPNTIHDIYAHLLKYLAIYYILVNLFSSRQKLSTLVWVMIASGMVYTLWYIPYFYLYLGHKLSDRLVIFPYRGYIYVVAFLLSIQMFLIQKRWLIRIIPLMCIFSTMAAIILSQTRSDLLAVIVGLLVYSLKSKKMIVLAVLIVIAGMAFSPVLMKRFTPEKILNSDRISTSLINLELIKDYPVFGIGFGMQTYGYKEYIDLESYNDNIPEKYRLKDIRGILGSPHNFLADTAVRTGIVGLCLFLYIMFCYVRMGYRLIRKSGEDFFRDWGICFTACFAGFFAQAMFGDAAFSLQAIVFYTILAMMTILWRIGINESPDLRSRYGSPGK